MDARTCSLLGDFLRYVEDLGLRTYDDLVIQNASDISRESDRIRVQKNKILLRETRQQDHVQRLGFMTMPFPQDRGPSLGFSVRSQSLHSVQDKPEQNNWDQDQPEQNHWDHHRKQPPPKPRRDPGTKLSNSDTDGLDGHLDGPLDGLVLEKQPPPKPRRNPNTQLSSCSDHTLEEEEPVYIEMGPNQNPDQDSDQDQEGVYEEMSFTSDVKPKPVPTPFPNLLSHRPPLLTLPSNPQNQVQSQVQSQAAGWTSPHTSDESPLTPLETALGQFFQDTRPKPQKNPGFKPEPRVRRTSDPVQDSERGLFKSRPEWSQSVDQIHPERGQHRGTRTAADPRNRRLDSEPDLRPDQRRYYSLRRDPTGRDPRKGIRGEQRRERSLESLEQVLRQDSDQDFTVTSSGRASAPPLTRSGPSPVPQSYRRSQSACPSPVKRPPPYEVIMMSSVTPHGGHMTRLRGSAASGPESGSTIPLRPGQNQMQSQEQSVPSQGSWFFGGVSLYGAPGFGEGPRLAAGDMLMMGTMERKRVLCREIRSRTARKPPPYGAAAPPAGGRGWDTEI